MEEKTVVRDTDTQILRIIAAFFVVLLHSAGVEGTLNISANIFSRFSVPLFIVISGYYMLSRQRSVKDLALKSGRLLILMFIWSAISFVYSYETQSGYLGMEFPFELNTYSVITYLLTQPFHLWYIYAAIGLYILTPILYAFCEGASKEQFRYALGVTFLLGSVVTILFKLELCPLFNSVINQMKIPYMTAFIFLYLMGGYIRKFQDLRCLHVVLFYLAAIAAMAGAIAAGIFFPQKWLLDKVLLNFFLPSSLLFAPAVFLFIHRTYTAHPIKFECVKKFIGVLSDNSLGVYLMHPFVFIFEQIYFYDIYSISFALNAAIAFAVSNIVIYIIRKIPVVRRLAG